MKASEAQKEMNDARASAEQAHLELEAVRANSDRRQVELQEQLVEAQQRNSEQSANVEQLKVEVLSKAEMLESAVGERDRLSIELSERSSELEQQSTQALEREKEFEALRYENREISTKLVALESMQAQHLAELEDLRRALDDSELTSKEVSARAETALSALAEMGSSLESQANDYEGKIERLGEGLASERASGIQATEHLESQLAEAIIKVGQLEAANTDAVMEIATLRASQSHAPTIVHPPAQSVDEATPQVAIAPVDDDAAVSALSGFDERARRLEGELAEAKNRLRATSSGVVWSARREPEVKEGLLGRLKGSIRRSGDH
jgi:chromosome segregation ATPase